MAPFLASRVENASVLKQVPEGICAQLTMPPDIPPGQGICASPAWNLHRGPSLLNVNNKQPSAGLNFQHSLCICRLGMFVSPCLS